MYYTPKAMYLNLARYAYALLLMRSQVYPRLYQPLRRTF